MASAQQTTYRVILNAVGEGALNATVTAVEESFGISLALAEKIVKAAPIVLLDKFPQAEAETLRNALNSVSKAGSELVVEQSGLRRLAVIGWPTPPHIDGHAVEAILAAQRPAPGLHVSCPCCGEELVINIDLQKAGQAAVAAQASAPAKPKAKPQAQPPAKPTATAKPTAPPKQAPPPPAPPAAAAASAGEADDPLFEGVSPLSPTVNSDHMVGSLDEFETGLINLYEMDDEDEDKK